MSDVLEIRMDFGMVCLRSRDRRGGVACIAIPAEMHADVHRTLHQAAVEAEEDFWKLSAKHFGSEDRYPGYEAWLLDQEWPALAARVPDPSEVFMITHSGHVGLFVDPPYAPRKTCLVLSPAQLHRTRPGRAQAGMQAMMQAGDPEVRSLGQRRAALAIGMMRTAPWPGGGVGVPEPEHAKRLMEGLYEGFLRRDAQEALNPLPD
ncbi:hypothetical protein OG730_09910 [Streptomyces sp. NBC_01298]|uniref:hypothetical protein n=1 Tax=Streptomyces sp. NBC_01298 TaxID=2903817 RepID=UPI002E11B973|nr:hypothetical protein OG730_09910 [Streptomyces sp. NBC_01298]